MADNGAAALGNGSFWASSSMIIETEATGNLRAPLPSVTMPEGASWGSKQSPSSQRRRVPHIREADPSAHAGPPDQGGKRRAPRHPAERAASAAIASPTCL